ncbi:MAG: PAS domain S-box protein [Verrucomicrobia bacterium]|nr:PAS domain S-box protein [Deltaproteobacteria bacterium]
MTGIRDRLAKYGYLLIVIAIIVVIAAAGYSFVQQQKQLVINEAHLDLSTIVDLKVSQIVEWRKERQLEATSIYSNTMISRRIKDYLNGREKAEAFEEIQGWMASLQNASGYSNVILFRPNGDVLISASTITTNLEVDRKLINAALRKKEAVLTDLHIHDGVGEFDINLIIPIIDPEISTSDCIAVIVIDINPLIHLYPLLRTWPTPSRTGENQLVRHDGDDVLYLNELRFRDKSALTLRQPLTQKNTPAVRAALGQEGVFEGLDYRGVDVIAAVRAVPNSPWAIVCKVDTTEVLEPVTERVWYVVATCLIILIAIGLASSLLWRRKREAYLFTQYETELKYNSELKQAEQALLEANNRLEERVERRTEELSSAILHLKQEIAERKQVEELLRKHFQAILQSPVAIIITDLDGIIEFVNPKFTEYSGYSYEEAIGQNPRMLKSEVTPPEIHKELWETIIAGNVWEGEICNKKKSGELYWEYAKILPIKSQDGILTNFMAFNEDITGHKLLEEKLLRSRKLETIGQIAGGVAHEVRNPLNAILSITEALFKEKEIEDNPEFEPYIQHIRTQVNRLAHLMNELLDLGKTIPTSSIHPVPLYEVCREAIDLWNSSGSAQKIPVILATDSDPLITCVMADRGRLVQIIFNLLENAAQHSPGNGKIMLDLIDSDACDPLNSMAIIRITDGGSGIPLENLAQVFDPFYTGRKGGTGLGLALVKHFIEDMNGTVLLFNNDPPPGCSAEVRIPTAKTE